MAFEDTFRRLFLWIREIEDRTLDLEAENGEIHGLHFGDRFPSSPYPNQIVVRTDESPPDGGVIYRYDQASNSWRRLS